MTCDNFKEAAPCEMSHCLNGGQSGRFEGQITTSGQTWTYSYQWVPCQKKCANKHAAASASGRAARAGAGHIRNPARRATRTHISRGHSIRGTTPTARISPVRWTMASKVVTIKRDPARAKRLILAYENELVGLFDEYREKVVAGLGLKTRALASGYTPPLTPEQLQRVIEQAMPWLLWQARQVARQATLQAYSHGQKYADLQLKRAGVDVQPVFFRDADARALDILQSRNLTALRGISEETNKRIVSELTDGLMKGEGADKLAARLTQAVDTIGITRARAMARTEVMYSLNQASMIRYDQQGVSRVVWIAGADGRCCDECLALNGKIFDTDNVPDIPKHVNCRCCLAPARRD
jgi:SPP1 gp7 family putative phage head morphogenesis protein